MGREQVTSRGRAVRVGIVALLQESNTFIDGRTTLEHFEQDVLCDGEEVRRRFEGTHHEVGGFFQGLDKAGIDAVPIFAARALPYGMLTTEAFETLLVRMDAALAQAGPLDGLLVAPHGATVCESIPDVDGCWLEMLRGRVGPRVPIIGTLDLHANLSPRMVAACNALIAYRTNPHLDQRERGLEAARLMAQTLRGEVRPTMAAAYPRLAINIERQGTTEEPCRSFMGWATWEWGFYENLCCCSVLLGFPYADVQEMGAAVIAITNDDPVLARLIAQEVATEAWRQRAAFQGDLITVDDALARACKMAGPTCMLDMGDNVGGGSPGDGTVLLDALHRARIARTFVCLHDPVAQQAARCAGGGCQLRMSVGGRTDQHHGEPFQGVFRVLGLYDGHFEEPEARHGGIKSFDQGPTAVVRTDGGMTVMLTSKRMVPFSLKQLTSCGIDPLRDCDILVAKGVHAPVAAYAPICQHRMIRVNTPGVTTADLSQLEYCHRRRPMFPFEPETQWSPDEITMGHQPD
jgi:microcystin degradation protein MlrC